MWVKLLKEIRYEGGIIPVGREVWLRRSAFVKQQHDGSFQQESSISTIEHGAMILAIYNEDGLWGDIS